MKSLKLLIAATLALFISSVAFAELHDEPNQSLSNETLDWIVPLQSNNKGIDMARLNPLLKAQKEKLAKHHLAVANEAKAAKSSDKKIDVASGTQQSALEQYQAQMNVDLARLKEVKNILNKAKLKKEFLETYKPFIEQYVAEKHQYPNNVLVRNMIWMFDSGATVDGIMLGIFLAKQGCHKTPAKFDRDIETFICDEVYDAFIKHVKAGEFNEETYSVIDNVLNTIEQDKWSLSPPVHSKLFALGA